MYYNTIYIEHLSRCHSNYYVSLRYGLYGLPFEPVLFDMTLQPTPKSSTPPPVSITQLSSQPSYPGQLIYQSQAKSYLGPGGPREPMTSTASISKTASGLNKATGVL